MGLGSHLTLHWPTWLIGFTGFGVAYYYFEQSRAERDPIFAVDPNRVEILSNERVSTAPIKVLRRNNTPITSDIYAVRFYFWNAGKISIREQDVLDTIRVALDSGNEILDFRPIKVSRLITQARLVADPPGRGLHTLAIVFSILERDDGLTGQVIYTGRRDARVEISGIIEGVAGGIPTAWLPHFGAGCTVTEAKSLVV